MEAETDSHWYNVHVNVVHDLPYDYVSEEDRNLPPGFYFVLRIWHTDEVIAPRLRVRIPVYGHEHKFHLNLGHVLYEDDDDERVEDSSVLDDLRARLSRQGVGKNAQDILMKEILGAAKSKARSTVYDPECSTVAVIGVEFEVVRVIETWEITKILEEGDGSGLILGQDQCVICLEEFLPGDEVIRMHCSHVHHRFCILNWLVSGNNCPTCRFAPACVHVRRVLCQ